MFCPLKFANPQVDMAKDFCDERMCQCEEEKCNWWIHWEGEHDVQHGCCAVAHMATRTIPVEKVP